MTSHITKGADTSGQSEKSYGTFRLSRDHESAYS